MNIKIFELIEIINKLEFYETKEIDISVKTRYAMAINIVINILMHERQSNKQNKSYIVSK